METKKIKTIMLSELTTFCYIIDEFENFNNKFLNFLKGEKCNIGLIVELWELSTGRWCIPRPKVREFYNSNKEVIDIINKYWSFCAFVKSNYIVTDSSAILSETSNLFYKYVLANKDKINKMIALVNKLKELGFSKFDFDSTADFSKETFSVITRFSENHEITYLENLEEIPSYGSYNVQYRTKGSAYKIVIDTFPLIYPDDEIILNDLTFDTDRLPSNISKDEIFAKILALPKGKKEQYTIIKNSVDIGVTMDDLYSIYHIANKKITDLENFDRKPELLEELRKIYEAIDIMDSIRREYNNQVICSNPEITQSQLAEEQKAYIRRREMSKTYLD